LAPQKLHYPEAKGALKPPSRMVLLHGEHDGASVYALCPNKKKSWIRWRSQRGGWALEARAFYKPIQLLKIVPKCTKTLHFST